MACLIINPYTGKEEESKLSIKLIEAYGVEQGESYYNNFVLPFIRKLKTLRKLFLKDSTLYFHLLRIFQ